MYKNSAFLSVIASAADGAATTTHEMGSQEDF